MASLFDQYQPTGSRPNPQPPAPSDAPEAPIEVSISRQALDALAAQKAQTGSLPVTEEPNDSGGGFPTPPLPSWQTATQVGGFVTGGPPGIAAAALGNEIIEGINPYGGKIKGKVSPGAVVSVAQQRGASTLGEIGDLFDVSDSSDYQNLVLQYDAAAKLFADSGDVPGFQAFAQAFTAQLPSLLGQIKTQEDQKRAAEQQERERTSRIIQMQNQFAPVFESIMANTGQNNQLAYTAAVDAADQLKATNPQLAALLTESAARSKSSADALMAAYAQQIQMAPANYQEIQQQQIASQYLPGA